MMRFCEHAAILGCAVVVAGGAVSKSPEDETPLASISIDLRGKFESQAAAPGSAAEVVSLWCTLPARARDDDVAGLLSVLRQTAWGAGVAHLRADIVLQEVSVARVAGGPRLGQVHGTLACVIPEDQAAGVEAAVRDGLERLAGPVARRADLSTGFSASVIGAATGLDVECRLGHGALVLGFGAGALVYYDRWRAHTPPPDPLEAFRFDLNLNQMRRCAGEAMDDHDPAARMLAALGLANARWLQGRVTTAVAAGGGRPALLLLECTYQNRSDGTDVSRTVRWSESSWPSDLGSTPGASAALVIRADPLGPGPVVTGGGWAGWLRCAIAASIACVPGAEEQRAIAATRAWQSRKGETTRMFTASMSRWAVVLFGATGTVSGQTVMYTRTKNSADSADRALRQVLSDFKPAFVQEQGAYWRLPNSAPALCGGLSFGIGPAPGGGAMACVVQMLGQDRSSESLGALMSAQGTPR